MIAKGIELACARTGFVPAHAQACVEVADRTKCMILFRAPGEAAQNLIADHYSMKGFRIDTKSCDWGPMYGFVCADPRLSKKNAAGGSYYAKNKKWTEEAIRGEINEQFFGHPSAQETGGWKADTLPIVISQTRIDELIRREVITAPARDGNGILTGTSAQTFSGSGTGSGTVTVPWALVPINYQPLRFNPPVAWLKGEKGPYFVLCIQNNAGFALEYPSGTTPIKFRGYETIQGMCNPGDKQQRGFKACVTADYDLFSIWPSGGSERVHDGAVAHHAMIRELNQVRIGRRPVQMWNPMPMNVPRLQGVDDRLRHMSYDEHFRYGDVSARVLNAKVLLNTAIQGRGGYRGGNAVHHNDEAGNEALPKGNLVECMPLIVFYPPTSGIYSFFGARGCAAILTTTGFATVVREAGLTYNVVCKRTWREEIRLL